MVCASCSKGKFVLRKISSKPLRVCDGCYSVLSSSTNQVDEKAKLQKGNDSPPPQTKKPSKSINKLFIQSNRDQPLTLEDSEPNSDIIDDVSSETKQIEQKEFVEFNNKHLSIIREESIEDGTPSTPPSTPVSVYPKPLPLNPIAIDIDIEPHPGIQKMFSVDIMDNEQLRKTLEDMPQASIEEPELEIKPRNPQLYQLCQMNSTSSFWWDASGDDSNDDFGLNFRSDGVPITSSASFSPIHPQLIASESVASYHFEEKGMLITP